MIAVYHPREDTDLLARTLRAIKLSDLRVLDMGTGSGALALECARRGAKVTAVDIDERAVAVTDALLKREGVQAPVFQSDLFSNVAERYDLIIFNPPYLPSEGAILDRAVDGGWCGRDIIEKFLEAMPEHLREGGCSLLLVSSLNNPQDLAKRFPTLSFTPIETEKLFFETLTILKVMPKSTYNEQSTGER